MPLLKLLTCAKTCQTSFGAGARVSKSVVDSTYPDMTFCTLCVATLQDNTLTYAKAGHDNPLLLTTPTHATPTFLPTDSDFPIGIEPDCQYTSGTYTLQQGDTILLYTDGVTEATDRSHQLFGAQRILDTLPPRPATAPNRITVQPSNRITVQPSNRPTVQPHNRLTVQLPNRPTLLSEILIPCFRNYNRSCIHVLIKYLTFATEIGRKSLSMIMYNIIKHLCYEKYH